MKIHFHIRYKTAPGESLCAVLFFQTQHEPIRQIVALQPDEPGQWAGLSEVHLPSDALMTYAYYVMQDGKTVRREWNVFPRQLNLSVSKQLYNIYDWWRDLPEKSWLYSNVFTKPQPIQTVTESSSTIILHASLAGLAEGQTLCICGESAALGDWKPEQAVALTNVGPNEWAVALDAEKLNFPVSYKFILKEENKKTQWESGPNRSLMGPRPAPQETAVYSDLTPKFPIPDARLAGVVLPVFSIRTEKDWGAGDFGSLKQLVDWAATTGQKMIQLLPVNDTSLTGTWQDSYPYNGVSVYALHPLYLDPAALPALSHREEKKFQKKRQKLNRLPAMDYEAVVDLKRQRLAAAYQKEGSAVLASPEFRNFWNQNAHWLPAYAMFSALRDRYNSANWQEWHEYNKFSEQAMRQFFSKSSPLRAQAYFYFYMQFVLHNQLLDAHRYARSKGVSLKGDIPIGVSPYSADAWTAPHLFHLNAQAGAPPDAFSETGQNWGFPTYNWQAMAQDGYEWWKQRFTHMANYFDAYRIDHVLGFFRIWEIPMHAVQGLLGQFSPALALSEQEIRNAGFPFEIKHTQPYITDEVLQQIFGEQADKVRGTYVMPDAEEGHYKLFPEYDTQRKIQRAFADRADEESVQLRDGLYALCANVLFVVDHRDPQLYHPRIGVLKNSVFHALPEDQQKAYRKLYDDYFYHRQDDFWKDQALEKLPALTQATSMLCCAEDLGMIPHCVPDVMNRLQMLSLEIQRMPKQMGHPFADTYNYPYLSVATPSTHDMSVLRSWWREDPENTSRFWHDVLGRKGVTPAEAPADACEQILHAHLNSPSMLCLISWQDWTAIDERLRSPNPDKERINIPSDPKHYWRYRMHVTVEELMQKSVFNQKIKKLIQESGR